MSNSSGGLALRGVLVLLFGIAATFWPGITIKTLIYLFSAFILIDGVVNLVTGLGRLFEAGRALWVRLLTVALGVLQVGVGVYLVRHLAITFSTLILLLGFLFIVRGVFEVVEALFGEGAGNWRALSALVGVLAVVAGIIILSQPASSGVAFVWILGLYGLITGPLIIAGALELNKLEEQEALVAGRRVRS